MDRLSKRKFGIVCHGKVVRIPLEGDEILRVHGERTQGVVKTLMNTKVVEFRVDLVPGATPVAKSPYRLAPLEMQELSEQLQELQNEGKANVVIDVLRRKERVKPRRVRAMAMTIQYGVRGMILASQSEAFKKENVLAERLHGKEWNSGDDQLRFRWMIYPVVLADVVEGVRDAIGFEYWVASSSGWTKYVRPFEILERIGPVAYRLRLAEELSGVHDTFHMSNLKKCLAGASLHVPLNEIKVDKSLRFIEEPVEILDREIRILKRSKISLVKVCWNSKRGPEFTWEREDYMKSKYPQLFVNRADESAN
ncbi:hypothetical protein Tco_0603171 [Tanacetum coccineum]